MKTAFPPRRPTIRAAVCLLLLLSANVVCVSVLADEPFARSRDYNLVHARIHLRFDLDQRKVIGETTQTLTVLREGVRQLKFDSVGLSIEAVSVSGEAGKFSTTPDQLVVDLAQSAKAGQKFEVTIRYSG